MVNFYFIRYSERYKGYKFYYPTIKPNFELGNARLFKDVEFTEGNIIIDFVFKEEYADIPMGIISIDRNFIIALVQDTTCQDNLGEPSI